MKNLSLSEIRQNALSFSTRWKNEKSERSESQTFWNEFFKICYFHNLNNLVKAL